MRSEGDSTASFFRRDVMQRSSANRNGRVTRKQEYVEMHKAVRVRVAECVVDIRDSGCPGSGKESA